jgi:cyclopropane fatty-acyl-phospholipid synthase-like methyltransferase
VDLNSDFSDQADISGQFDLIIAVEIIEHLENPYHFARQLKSLLAPNGTIIVSTPNIESAASRIHFLRSADFRWFGDYFYRGSGHITPLTIWQLTNIFDRARLQIAGQSHTMHDAIVIRDKDGPGTYRTPLSTLAIYPFMLGHRNGDIHVMAVQHRKEN